MEQESEEIFIDARWLEPPEPFDRVMQALALIRPGQHIRLLLHREPVPLYAILKDQGYSHHTTPLPDGTYVILIGVASA